MLEYGGIGLNRLEYARIGCIPNSVPQFFLEGMEQVLNSCSVFLQVFANVLKFFPQT